MNSISMTLRRTAVYGVGLQAAAGARISVDPLTAAALLDADAAQLVRPEDLSAVHQAVRDANMKLAREAVVQRRFAG
jgi:hypothetical protein